MSLLANGTLIPVGGGDPIPLLRATLTLGRRESCDVCLRFPNVSGVHCELNFHEGHWFVIDLGSTNGIKINGIRVPSRTRKILHPEDTLTIARRDFTIQYEPYGQNSLAEIMEREEELLSQPLLDRAGLIHRRTLDDFWPMAKTEKLVQPDHESPSEPSTSE